MHTKLEFVSSAFPAYPGEEDEINPGIHGKRLAEFLSDRLSSKGYVVTYMDYEDWGWRIDFQNKDFSLWIGCGTTDIAADDKFLCFIEPSRPFVRKWFRRIATIEVVERLANALEESLRERDDVRNIRWQNDNQNERL